MPTAPKVNTANPKVVWGSIAGFVMLSGLMLVLSPSLDSLFGTSKKPAAAPPPMESFDPQPLILANIPQSYPQPVVQPVAAVVPPAPPKAMNPTPVQPVMPYVPPPQPARPASVPRPGSRQTGPRAPKEPLASPFPASAPAVKRDLPAYLTKSAQETQDAMQADQSAVVNKGRVVPAPGRYAIMAGTVIPADLYTEVNSDLCGQVVGHVALPVYDTRTGRHELIPQYTTLIGSYDCDIKEGANRIAITWHRLIFPNTTSLTLDDGAGGVDQLGRAGMTGKVDNHYGKLAVAVLASTLLSVGTRMAAGDINTESISPQQEFAVSASRNINQTGQQIVGRALQIKPTIWVPKGSRFFVMLGKDLVLEPYRE
jgi:type IV secretion system protein VirB10